MCRLNLVDPPYVNYKGCKFKVAVLSKGKVLHRVM